MTLLYQNPSLENLDGGGESASAPSQFSKLDTTVPPKAKPIIGDILVNGEKILEREILAEAQNHPADSPGLALQESAKALVIRELLWQEAQRQGITGKLAKSDSDKIETEKDAAISELIDSVISIPNATEEECRKYFEKNKAKFVSEPLYEARHILIAAPASNSMARKDAKAQAEVICARLIEDKSEFSKLAKEFSACTSKEHEGNLGQLSRGSTVKEFEDALNKLNEGEITPVPVATKFGFHIISLDRKIAGKPLPFETVRERISIWLEASSWSKSVSQFISILTNNAEIEGIDFDSVI